MTNTTTNGPVNGAASHYNVVAICFDDDQNAYTALTKLKELDSQGQLDVQEALVVQRGGDGSIAVKDRVGTIALAGTATGGLLGLLIGVLGGPVGVLIGGYTGVLFGSLYDLDDSDRVETTLGEISKTVQPDRQAVLALVSEQSPEVIDVAMTAFGGAVVRRPVHEVEAEVAVAAKAERKAAREAQLELMRAKREQTRESAHAKVEELKAKLSHSETKQSAGATS
jgi:uncharacterized membrane protein